MSNSEGNTTNSTRPKNNVRVSSQRSKFMFADLTKRLLSEGEKEVVVSAINSSIPDAVSVIEMLKVQNLVNVIKIRTCRMDDEEDSGNNKRGNMSSNADKIEIVVVKAKDFDKLYAEQRKEHEEKKAEKDKQ